MVRVLNPSTSLIFAYLRFTGWRSSFHPRSLSGDCTGSARLRLRQYKIVAISLWRHSVHIHIDIMQGDEDRETGLIDLEQTHGAPHDTHCCYSSKPSEANSQGNEEIKDESILCM